MTRAFVAGEPVAWQLEMHTVLKEAMRLAEGALETRYACQRARRHRAPVHHPSWVWGLYCASRRAHGRGLTHPHNGPYIAPLGEICVFRSGTMVIAIEPGYLYTWLGRYAHQQQRQRRSCGQTALRNPTPSRPFDSFRPAARGRFCAGHLPQYCVLPERNVQAIRRGAHHLSDVRWAAVPIPVQDQFSHLF